MSEFTFNISLSILNHLGRNLYRNFITVLGEAISNSWDADAKNVWITINKEENIFIIKDDGCGMTREDFQSKFLKIGYSKRKDGTTNTLSGRPFIGRKGIGKLALLSCASKISIISKTITSDFIGGTINNSELSEAIKEDENAYSLDSYDNELFTNIASDIPSGTIIYFQELNEGIKNRIEYIRKLVALYFKFSLIDDNFNIFLNGTKITLDELDELSNDTQLLWNINKSEDPYLTSKVINNPKLKRKEELSSDLSIAGFIASVDTPSKLKIRGSDEKVSIDLFVNGRLREKDILKHIHTSRLPESYIYGQIHYNDLDDNTDRFTSSREGIVSDDPKFVEFIREMERIIRAIIKQWDVWRLELNQEGDIENTEIVTRKERKSKELFGAITEEFIPPKTSPTRSKVEDWVNKLGEDAKFNFSSYGECFVSENLLRTLIIDKNIAIPPKLIEDITKWKKNELDRRNTVNISFDIRADNNDLSFCSMDELAYLADDETDKNKKASLKRDAQEYKPIRDAMAHTARLTSPAKNKLNATYENIKARIKTLLAT